MASAISRQRDVVGVILEKVQLDFVRSWTREIKVIQRATVRRNQAGIGDAVQILKRGRFRLRNALSSPWRNSRGRRLCLSRGLFVVEAPRITTNTHRFSASIPREIHGASPRGSFATGC